MQVQNTEENPNAIQSALLSLPRRDRAREQGQQWLYEINGQRVVRLTRRYWSVSGNDVKITNAIALLS
jgi:hypothetical protein